MTTSEAITKPLKIMTEPITKKVLVFASIGWLLSYYENKVYRDIVDIVKTSKTREECKDRIRKHIKSIEVKTRYKHDDLVFKWFMIQYIKCIFRALKDNTPNWREEVIYNTKPPRLAKSLYYTIVGALAGKAKTKKGVMFYVLLIHPEFQKYIRYLDIPKNLNPVELLNTINNLKANFSFSKN